VRLLFSLLFTTTLLFAAKLTEYHIYQNPDRIDLMLNFDTPWNGKISKTMQDKQTILLLEGVTFSEAEVNKQIDNALIDRVEIRPLHDKTAISLQSETPFLVNASKTIDNLGLRIRITPYFTTDEAVTPLKPIPQSKERIESDSFAFAFIKIMLVLAFLIALLWFLKKWMQKGGERSWLFGAQNSTDAAIKILEQKPIDMRNRVVLVSYEERKYLLLIGEHALLIDTLGDEEASFETLLQKQGKKLGDFLKE
jgi:flagellar biogenesis protein FliO